MNILYGVCGEGLGHSSRSKVIIEHLIKHGHKVLIITYGQAYPVLKGFSVLKIEGFSLSFQESKLLLGKTIVTNFDSLIKNVKNWEKIKKRVNSFKPQICITDMEFIVPIFSYWYNLPLISIDNQHRLTHLPLNVPMKYKSDYLLAKAFVNRCVSDADEYIILSFTKEKSKRENTYIISPVLRKEILSLKPHEGRHVLVYQSKPDYSIIKKLKKLPDKFIIYGYNIEKKEGNLLFKKDRKSLLPNLSSSKAVIASAGFTLISESLYLKKPYFAIPLRGQFEQTLNALFLKQSGYGAFSENPSSNKIQSFLSTLPKYKKALNSYKSDPKEALVILDNIIKKIASTF